MAKMKEAVLTAHPNLQKPSCPVQGKAHAFLTLQHHLWETNRVWICLWCMYTPYWIHRSWRVHLTHDSSPCAVHVIGQHNSCIMFTTKQKTHQNYQPSKHTKYEKQKPSQINSTKFWYWLNLSPKKSFQKSALMFKKPIIKIPNNSYYFNRVEMHTTLCSYFKKMHQKVQRITNTHTQKLHLPTKKPPVYQ